MNILGISCYYHDAAAVLVKDGKLVAAAQEERFTRKKHDPDLPINAIQYCLKEGKIGIHDVDHGFCHGWVTTAYYGFTAVGNGFRPLPGHRRGHE